MVDYVFDLEADFPIPTVDGNLEFVWDVNLKLAPDHDNYGVAVFKWTHLDGPLVVAGWPVGPGALFYEQTGLLKDISPFLAVWSAGLRRDVQYKDADVVLHVSDTDPGFGLDDYIYWWLWKDNLNGVCIRYASQAVVTNHKCRVFKLINGVMTPLATSLDLGPQPVIYLRIKRITGPGTQTFELGYSYDGIAWFLVFTGVIHDAVHFNEFSNLYPLYALYVLGGPLPYNVEADAYYQRTVVIPPQRWMPTNPKLLVTDQGQGEWCLDAGLNNGWFLSAFSAVLSTPGTSLVLWTWGIGDLPDSDDAVWDNLPRSTAAISAKCAAGDFDGKQYVFLRVHYSSTGLDRPDLTSCTFTGFPANVTCRKPLSVTLSYFAPTNILRSTWDYPLPMAVSFWLDLEKWDSGTSAWILVAEGRFSAFPQSADLDYEPLDPGDKFRLLVFAQCKDCVHSAPVTSNEVTIPA